MVGNRNVVHEMQESFAMIRLEDKEYGGISYEDTTEELFETDI